MNKLKILWFILVPIGWFLAFRLIIWIQNYPINWIEPSAIDIFLVCTGIFGTIALIFGAISIAIHLQD